MTIIRLTVIAAAVVVTILLPALAQTQLPTLPPPPRLAPVGPPSVAPAPSGPTVVPPAGPQAQGTDKPQPAPPGPYATVPIKTAGPVDDPSFDAFRKQLVAIAARKDRDGLARLISPGFFWFTYQGDQVDKSKSAYENFAKAVGIDGTDNDGWEFLTTQAADPSLSPFAIRPGTQCSPAGPILDYQAFDQLVKATKTQVSEWAYPDHDGVAVHASKSPKSQVIEKLGRVLVRVLAGPDDDDQQPPPNQNQPPPAPPPLQVVTPSGRTGWVAADDLWRLTFEQICYAKDAGGWKITGYLEGG